MTTTGCGGIAQDISPNNLAHEKFKTMLFLQRTRSISLERSEHGTVRGMFCIVDRYLASTTKHTIAVDRWYRDRARS